MNEKQRKILSASAVALALVFIGVITWLVGQPMIRFVSDPEQFRNWVDQYGIWSRVAFVGMVIFQVLIALIPGEPLEIGAGYAFGFWEGTILCVVGITIGSMIIFGLVRRFGVKLVEVFFSMDKIRSLKFLQNERRLNSVTFLIFMIPGTPKDLLCYFVGLTPIRFSIWFFISMIARIPSIVTSTIGGDALSSENYRTALWVFGCTVLFSVGGFFLFERWARRKREKEKQE